MALRLAAGIIGAFFLIQGINWITRPAAAAEALGMPLLDGLARSTQIGDMASFFVALGTMSLLGAARMNPLWLHAAALLLGGAKSCPPARSFSWPRVSVRQTLEGAWLPGVDADRKFLEALQKIGRHPNRAVDIAKTKTPRPARRARR